MPVHDWSKVEAGVFHSFHHFWLTTLTTALNAGVLPPDYYALPEQVIGPGHPDVLGLQRRDAPLPRRPRRGGGGTATATRAEIEVSFEDTADRAPRRPKYLSVRHVSGDKVVAIVEVVSASNKDGRDAAEAFAAKLADYIVVGVHLLVLDLHRPGRADPNGIHPLIWKPFKKKVPFILPAEEPLTLAAYAAGDPVRAYVEPVAVGETLPDMPLFLTPESHVLVPLEASYAAAWAMVPPRWRDELDPPR